MFSDFVADLRYAARALRRTPGFVLITFATLAVGIGANVAVFSLFQQILLRPLPVFQPGRLVNLTDPGPKQIGQDWMTATSGSGGLDTLFSYPMFRDLERLQAPFSGLAAHRPFEASLSTGEQARRDRGVFVSGSYFSVLGLRPAAGRLLDSRDERVPAQADSVVLSHAYWQSDFGGDPNAVGRRLIVNGVPLTIVGVAPAGFDGTAVGARPSVFVPISFHEVDAPFSIPNHERRDWYWAHLFARLKPGVTREQAAAALNRQFHAILSEIEAPAYGGIAQQEVDAFRERSLVLAAGARGQTRQDRVLTPARNRLEMLLAVSGAVLLLCCANVAGLILVRGSARTGEIAVRTSMGATRVRILSLLLAESTLLALPAALASLPVALLVLRGVQSGIPGIPPAAVDVSLSLNAAFVAIGVAVLSALAFGLWPARALLRAEPGNTLQLYGTRQTSAKGVMRFRTGLATVQIALAMALLGTTGVLAQSLANIARIDLGLDLDSVVMFSMAPAASGYDAERQRSLFDRLDEALEAIPGVSSATSSQVPLLSGGDMDTRFKLDGSQEELAVSSNRVATDYFATFGVGLLAGREFRDSDTLGSPTVAIVNRRLAERLGLGAQVIGRRVEMLDAEIVGIVADAKSGRVTGEVLPQIFWPTAQSTSLGSATFYVRGALPPEDLVTAIRETATRVDPFVPITDLRTMDQQVRQNLSMERFVAQTSTALAVLATLLAALGLYGVLAYSVAQRSREIALRVALGAQAHRIRRMVLAQIAAMVTAGIALGVGAAWLLGQAARGLLFGVGATDAAALGGAVAILAAVALAAAYLPARRAARLDPMSVLRYE